MNTPTRVSLRRVLISVIRSDSDFSAFCIDYFPDIFNRFGDNMDRFVKLNLLLTNYRTEDILSALKQAHPEISQFEHLIEYGDGLDRLDQPGNSPVSSRDRRNRRRMIDKIRKFWIDSVLEKSLHEKQLIELEKETRPAAMENPWDSVIQSANKSPERIQNGKKMIDLFDENLGELLILGIPGSGKTTMLLSLCRDLLHRAESNDVHPIPTVFHLSTWPQKRLELDKWLIDELRLRYDVPTAVGKEWIESNRIIPLLDGLDEVIAQYREECAKAIDSYHRAFEISGLVVCSRTQGYNEIKHQFRLQQAIELQDLTIEQINKALTKHKDRTRETIVGDKDLRELAKNPLMFNIILNSPWNIAGDIKEYGIEQKKNRIVGLFYEQALSRRRIAKFLPERVNKYISNIAQYMINGNNSIFYIEDLQTSLLAGKWKPTLHRYGSALIMWTAFFLPIGILGNLVKFALNKIWPMSLMPISTDYYILLWLLGLAVPTAIYGKTIERQGIRPRDRMRWSLKKISSQRQLIFHKCARMSFRIALPCSIFSMLACAIFLSVTPIFLLMELITIFFFIFSLIAIVSFIVLIAKVALINDAIPARRFPNQGIIQSTIMFVNFVAIYTLTHELIFVWKWRTRYYGGGDFPHIIISYLGTLMIIFYFLAPMLGGDAAARHYMLRLVLFLGNVLPLKLVRFMDCLVDRGLLYKVGGGYVFVHRLLMEHCASPETEMRPRSQPSQSSTTVRPGAGL